MDETVQILAVAKRIAAEAGGIMAAYFDRADKQTETKQDSSPVTAADKLINQLVIDRIAEVFPEHGVLAEEGSSHEDRRELWVCDPIDGTKGFIQGIPTAMFSLAFVVDGVPEVAVMYDPFQTKLYSAVRGEGARVNDKPLAVSDCTDISHATIAISTGYRDLYDRRPFFDDLLERGVNQLIVPGNVFKSTIVARGNADGYIFPGKSAHDVAAAKLIIEEAGGKVTDLYGKEQRYDGPIYGAIISNGRIHDALVESVQAFGADKYIGY